MSCEGSESIRYSFSSGLIMPYDVLWTIKMPTLCRLHDSRSDMPRGNLMTAGGLQLKLLCGTQHAEAAHQIAREGCHTWTSCSWISTCSGPRWSPFPTRLLSGPNWGLHRYVACLSSASFQSLTGQNLHFSQGDGVSTGLSSLWGGEVLGDFT